MTWTSLVIVSSILASCYLIDLTRAEAFDTADPGYRMRKSIFGLSPTASMRPAIYFEDESEVRFCGCEEMRGLYNLKAKAKTMTPQDFLVDQDKLWLGEVETLRHSKHECGQLCLSIVNRRTTHFVTEANSCQCYSGLKPFHCEEEEGVALFKIFCLEKVEKRLRRPMLTMLNRAHNALVGASETPSKTKSATSFPSKDQVVALADEATLEAVGNSKTSRSTRALASLILLAVGLMVIALMAFRTWHEHKRKLRTQKNASLLNNASFYTNQTR